MKKVLFIFAICILAGCANKADKAQKAAEQFLDAYITNDFTAATELCSEDFKELFGKTIKVQAQHHQQVLQQVLVQGLQVAYLLQLELINMVQNLLQ